MAGSILQWPDCVLRPQIIVPRPVPFTRSGGTTLGGVTPATSTDLGYWRIEYSGVTLRNKDGAAWRAWQAIRRQLGGRYGLIEVPVWARLSAPYENGFFELPESTTHSDDTPFDDDSEYVQDQIIILSSGATAVGRTSITVNVIKGSTDIAGAMFSYQGALYECGAITETDGPLVTVGISPTVRELIPSGAELNFVKPTCICRLASDSEMDIPLNFVGKYATTNVSFEEATDYWNELSS